MDYLEDKLPDFKKGLEALEEVLSTPKTVMVRDAGLKRFEFTFELFWKTLKLYLKEIEKVDCYSPASCIREARRPFDINDDVIEICLDMAKDRNLTVHIYSEEMADEMFSRLPKYLETMDAIAKKIEDKMKS